MSGMQASSQPIQLMGRFQFISTLAAVTKTDYRRVRKVFDSLNIQPKFRVGRRPLFTALDGMDVIDALTGEGEGDERQARIAYEYSFASFYGSAADELQPYIGRQVFAGGEPVRLERIHTDGEATVVDENGDSRRESIFSLKTEEVA